MAYKVKKCQNDLCGKIMYSGQHGFSNKFCSKDCLEERGRPNNFSTYNKSRIKTRYKHKYLPITLIID